MELLTPAVGLVFWTVLFFIIAWSLLGKFAWKPIVNMLDERNKSIEEALKGAKKAQEELKGVQKESQAIIKDARLEREDILKNAKKEASDIVEKARKDAETQGATILSEAKQSIDREKMLALASLKAEIASISVSVASKLLGEELKVDDKQKKIIDTAIADLKN